MVDYPPFSLMATATANINATTAPSLVDSLFQRSLDDLIRSLRSTPSLESTVISRTLSEIRREIRSTDHDTKSTALEKLTYLSSIYHVDMSFASFHAIELLPLLYHRHKRIGYLAASLSFNSSTDVLLLITNQLRKDLGSISDPVVSLALEFIAVAATGDLARDLTPEVHNLLASSRVTVRKKATAAVLRVFTKCPDSVRIAFKRLVENMESVDQRIVSAAIGVFCELSGEDPRAYLPLAPEFYRILVDCRNNWVLIKVLKIFTRLAPLEPRLAKKIVEPICEHMRRSNAKSLVFECARTVFLSLYEYEHAVRLAVEKVGEFLSSEDDPNLQFLGLRALSMLKPMYSWAVEENKEVIVKSLTDSDPNIQREALHLVMGLVTEGNVVEISSILVNQALKSDPLFCNEILGAILSTCSRNFYELLVDFEWYVSILGGMARNPHCAIGEEIERQLLDISFRVKDVRPELVQTSRDLLIDPALLGNPFLCRILSAAAWISGEYVGFSRNPFELVEALLQPRISLLPTLVKAVYIQAVFKVIIFCYSSYMDKIEVGQFADDSKLVNQERTLANNDKLGLNPSSSYELDEATCAEGQDASVCDREDSALGLAEIKPEIKDPFTFESLTLMLNLVKAALSPLTECNEVEVQERARNVLGLILVLQEAQDSKGEKDASNNMSTVAEIVRFMQDALSEELGLVLPNAQEKVPVPSDLELLDNLSDLQCILGEIAAEMPPAPIFVLQTDSLRETGESEPPAESSYLLAEHRKRHGLYYLSAEMPETEATEFPRANDPHTNAAEFVTGDLLGSTQKPQNPKKSKPRPLVIKLDEEDVVPNSSTKSLKESNNDSLSGAGRNFLLGSEDEHASSKKESSDKSSHRRAKDVSLNKESDSGSKDILGDPGEGSSKGRHHSHGKHKHKHKNSLESEDKRDGKTHGSHRSDHNRDRRKHRQRGDKSLDVAPQAPVIQDFLL